MTDGHLVEVHRYPFSKEALPDIESNAYAGGHWPLVYILSGENQGKAYVGETTDALTRLSAHLTNDQKRYLTSVHLVSDS